MNTNIMNEFSDGHVTPGFNHSWPLQGSLLAENPAVMSQFVFLGLIPAGRRAANRLESHKASLVLHAPSRPAQGGMLARAE